MCQWGSDTVFATELYIQVPKTVKCKCMSRSGKPNETPHLMNPRQGFEIISGCSFFKQPERSPAP